MVVERYDPLLLFQHSASTITLGLRPITMLPPQLVINVLIPQQVICLGVPPITACTMQQKIRRVVKFIITLLYKTTDLSLAFTD